VGATHAFYRNFRHFSYSWFYLLLETGSHRVAGSFIEVYANHFMADGKGRPVGWCGEGAAVTP
jgi:hypothetical protein